MKTPTLILSLIALCVAALSQQAPAGKTRIFVPGVQGVLELDTGSANGKTTVQNAQHRTQLDAAPRPDRLQITAFIWQVGFPAAPEKCKEESWREISKQPVTRQNLQENNAGQMDRVEYMIPEYNGAAVRQKNVHAYLGARDLCAEVRLAKMLFNPGDQKLFDDVLDSVRLLPDEAGSAAEVNKSGADQLFEGSKSMLFDGTMAYLDKDFSSAADLLQSTLDREKQKRTLNREDFRLLIDNLAISYRFTHNQAKSKEVLEYGLSQDSKYPLFHYDLACYYGLEGDMNKALDELRLTYKNKSELSPSDQLSDPLQEACFGKFLKNKEFVKAVEEMKGQ
ncbi:MAG TPA: hypothetical protein VHA33_27465 [Candidatus Angelobacter sp.]|nr:hypothetical protein [Candidatus Angelobacter sp.]